MSFCNDNTNYLPFPYLATKYTVEALTDYLKSLSPSTLDMELRMLQIIDDDDEQEPENRPELYILELVLEYLIHEISFRNNFEFIQALIRLFLKVCTSYTWLFHMLQIADF